MTRFLVLLLALAAVLPARAQSDAPLQPGDDRLDTSRLASEDQTYTITILQGPMRQDIGTMEATLVLDEDAETLTAIRSMEMMGQKLADTMRVAWPSLEAQYHHSNNMQRRLRFAVSDGMLAGEHQPSGGAAEAFEMSVDGPVFDSAWVGTLAALLPLEAGYTVTVPAYEYEAGGLAEYTITVVGEEEIQLAPGHKATLWHLTTAKGDDDAVHFYIDGSDYRMTQMRMSPQPGLDVYITDQSALTGAGK